jgi:hypothetical protein
VLQETLDIGNSEPIKPDCNCPVCGGTDPGAICTNQIEAFSFSKCEHCSKPFARREGSGGSVQRFCSQACRLAFRTDNRRSHTDASEQPTPPASSQRAELDSRADPTEKRSPAAKAEAFDWSQSEVLLPPVAMTAAYIDRDTGELVIGQDDPLNGDPVIRIPSEEIDAFIDRLTDVIGIPSAGKF